MPSSIQRAPTVRRLLTSCAMKDELTHALVEALYELDVLPEDEEGAIVGLYAVMDDLDRAIRRTQAMDVARSA